MEKRRPEFTITYNALLRIGKPRLRKINASISAREEHKMTITIPFALEHLHCAASAESYLLLVYLVTALVPSETACLASSPGSSSLTDVWTSLEVMVDLLL